MTDANQSPAKPPVDEGDFGAEEGVSVPTSVGHGRLSVEENVPGTPAPSGQPPKDTDATGVTP